MDPPAHLVENMQCIRHAIAFSGMCEGRDPNSPDFPGLIATCFLTALGADWNTPVEIVVADSAAHVATDISNFIYTSADAQRPLTLVENGMCSLVVGGYSTLLATALASALATALAMATVAPTA